MGCLQLKHNEYLPSQIHKKLVLRLKMPQMFHLVMHQITSVLDTWLE